MTKKMTKEQQLAVKTTDRAVIVSANAGSGKTSTMIARLVKLVEEHKCSVSEILALTFTRSATTEMKQRLFSALQKSDVLSEDEKRRELTELNVSDISSLDGFCQKIIKKYFYVKGIDPNFGVIDEVEAGYLKAKALEDTFSEFGEKSEFLELAQVLGATKNLSNISELVYSFSSFLSTLKSPKTFLDNQLKNSAQQYNLCVHYVLDCFKADSQQMRVALREMKSTVEICGYDEKNNERIDLLIDFLNLFKTFRLDETKHFAEIPDLPKAPSDRKGKTEDELEFRKQMNDKTKEYVALLSKYAVVFSFGNTTKLAKSYENSLVYVKTLCRVTEKYIENYAKMKSARNVLDFTDLEDRAIEILRDENVKKETRSRYKFICVDEFQDTNEKQSELLSLVCGENNTFFVGDPKQSIYKFRQCDLNIFVELIEKFKADKSKKFIAFKQNFRSHKHILMFVNKIFKNIMTKDVANIDYVGDNEFSNLNVRVFRLKGALENVRPRKVGYIDRVTTYYLVKGDDKVHFESVPMLKSCKKLQKCAKKLQNDAKIEENSTKKEKNKKQSIIFKAEKTCEIYSVVREQKRKTLTKTFGEGDVVVSYITRFFENKIRITDPETKRKRPVRFSDFVILLRDRKHFDDYIEALNGAGIPVSAKFKLNLVKEPCVMNLINILRAVSNPHQDLPLACSLKIIGGFSERELFEIRENYKDDYFFKACQNLLNDDSKNSKLKEELQNFTKKLEKYRVLAQNFTVSQLLYYIIDDCNLKNYFLSQNDGVDKLKQVELFLAKLEGKSFETSVDEFLHFIDSFEKAFEVDYSTVSSDNCVKITTIHDSKGLEYPITIVGGCGNAYNFTKDSAFCFTKELGLAGNDVDLVKRTKVESIAHVAVLKNKQMDELLEEMRILYVALTRPKEYLMLVGAKPKSVPERVVDVKCIYDFIEFMEK